MPIVKIGAAGQYGVNKDLSASELPPNVWTDSRNVRFLDGSAVQFLGHGQTYDTPSVIPYHVLPVYVGANRYWIYAGANKVYAVASATGSTVHTEITQAATSYGASRNAWTSASLSGIPILNPGNTSKVPQQWDTDITHKLADLSNWPASTYCKSLRAFRSFLFALNVTKSGTNYPYMVKWSHPAVPGAVPSSWDATDTTKDAGEFDLAEGGDQVVDGLQLGQSFLIYKQSSIWRADYAGGPYVFNFAKVFGTSGAMNVNCVVEIDGFHVALTNDDVIVHDGQSATSVLDKQSRRALFQMIDAQANGLCFVFKNPFLNEVFVCFPQAGSSTPDLALVWNYKDKTVAYRDLPNLNHAACGPVESGISQPWSSDSSPWGSDVSTWNSAEYTPGLARVMMGSNDTKLFLLDSSTTFDGTLPTAYVERRGLSLGDSSRFKVINSVLARIQGTAGELVTIKVGGHDTDPSADPTWDATLTHTLGTTLEDFCMVQRRFVAIRIEGAGAFQWKLDSLDLDVMLGDRF
jgi:hypothetical protein